MAILQVHLGRPVFSEAKDDYIVIIIVRLTNARIIIIMEVVVTASKH